MDNIKQEDIKEICFNISKKLILPKYQNLKDEDIKYKNGSDLVTSVDIAAENELKKNLLKILPSSNFIGEEEYSVNKNILKSYQENSYCWTVDPIDGTKNFINGKDKFAIMIALSYKNKILESWIYKPLIEELSYSKVGEGAFINNRKIFVSKSKNIKNSIGSISYKYWDDEMINKIKKIKENFKKIDSYGSIGLEYVDIGRGIRDFTILSKLSPWDHIPGVLFVRESGGKDCHFDNSQYKFFDNCKNLIVSNSYKLNREIIKKLEEI